MQSGIDRALAPRALPNGKLYCAELARTENEQDDCLGDVEDTLFKSEADKARGRDLFAEFVRQLKLQRSPCGFLKRMFNRDECR